MVACFHTLTTLHCNVAAQVTAAGTCGTDPEDGFCPCIYLVCQSLAPLYVSQTPRHAPQEGQKDGGLSVTDAEPTWNSIGDSI